MVTATDRQLVEAVYDGDFVRCGSCGTRGPMGMAPIRTGAEYTCQSCKARNSVPQLPVRK